MEQSLQVFSCSRKITEMPEKVAMRVKEAAEEESDVAGLQLYLAPMLTSRMTEGKSLHPPQLQPPPLQQTQALRGLL
jgi:hypothetical protein